MTFRRGVKFDGPWETLRAALSFPAVSDVAGVPINAGKELSPGNVFYTAEFVYARRFVRAGHRDTSVIMCLANST